MCQEVLFRDHIGPSQVRCSKQLCEAHGVGKVTNMNPQLFEETFEHLPSSPIVESIIQWTARASVAANDTTWHSRFAQLLPEFPKAQPLHWQSIETMIDSDGSSQQTVNRPWIGLRLESQDSRWIVQADWQGVVLSRLCPYIGWTEFSTLGIKVWGSFLDCTHPTEIQKLGVRSINQISIESFGDVRYYLKHPPECLDDAELPANGFMYQSLHRIPNQPYQVNVLRTIPPKNLGAPVAPSLIVDIDAMTTEGHLDVGSSQEHFRALKWVKDKTFFNLMTEEAIEKFRK